MHVADIMTTGVIAVRPETSVREVAGILVNRGISGIPVMDDLDRPLGIVSGGRVHLRGAANSDADARAAVVAAEEAPGVLAVESHLGGLPCCTPSC